MLLRKGGCVKVAGSDFEHGARGKVEESPMRLPLPTPKAASLTLGRVLCAAILVVFAAEDLHAQERYS